MSDADEAPSVEDRRAELAETFDRNLDPLAKHAEKFTESDVDPFELFQVEILQRQNYRESTRAGYRRLIGQWRDHMAEHGRHPACPNEKHVRSFAEYCLEERENQPDTVRTKLRRLTNIYQYWQSDSVFPHPRDFNPFVVVLSKMDLQRPEVKDPPRIPIPKLRTMLASVTHLRDRAIIATQLKLGLRASELCNLQIGDFNLESAELKQAYPELGTHSAVSDRPNAVYIATREEREGNKSRKPRVLPIDEELDQLLSRYLLVRPDIGSSWVFLSQTTHSQLTQEYTNELWTDVFRPEYAETDEHRAVTSHFGRHRFSTYWRIEQDLNRELVKYMRGDTPQVMEDRGRETIDSYLHTYYADIEPVYRNNIFKLGLNDTVDDSC
ncbi:site-specific integrase [Natronomonas halophila]|uniref:tyrosine-type recombinase/integrase n=1 Tax=Natronomonas halophila TaxID=2747817 RepID=UPI0015B38445|nr:site-specific integrase [Natronomonas halophila]QLD85288.1 site-specific integrase [Natronomonas halophila]